MNDLIILKNNLSDIIQVLSSISEKFKVQDSQIIIFPSENSDTPYKEDIKLTVSHHVERLKIARDLLSDTSKIKDFNLKINLYNLKQLLYITKSMTNLVYKNSDFLHAAMSRINELNSKLLRTAIFRENEIIFNTIANNSKQINTQYEFLGLFKKNEQLIKNLSICLSDIFITYDLTKIIKYQEKIEPYIKDENIVFFNSLTENKEEYQSLLFKLIESKVELNEFQTKQINFEKVIEQYHTAKLALDLKSKEVAKILNESTKELNTYQTISSFLDNEYTRLNENKEFIDSALHSINEINKVGDDSKEINNYMAGKKKEISEILDDARDTISILSGSSIAEHLSEQERKESRAASGWLVISGSLMVTSLYFAVKGYNENIFDWNFFTLKILTLPILLSSLFFSMRQYIKRRNIVDSYSYKKTLALSLAGFKKQIDKSVNNEEQTEYILKTIEILTESPLNDLDKNHIKNDLDALEKIRESLIDNVISTIKNQTTDKNEKKQSTP